MARAYVFDRAGRPVVDPWTVLGLPAGAGSDEIRAAYRAGVLAHPPESDPEGFRTVSSAYRLLTDPSQVLERHLGRLSIAPPSEYDLPGSDPAQDDRSARELLAGELLLYALAEALLAP